MIDRVILIASAAYVDAELEAEFGRLPPAFLPLGSKRLFVHQREVIGDFSGRILLSLPEDFEIQRDDMALLRNLGIEVVLVPSGLSLGQSLIYVINVTATSHSFFSVMHGDTLLRGLDFSAYDVASIAQSAEPGYRWGHVNLVEDRLVIENGHDTETSHLILSGYFAFGHVAAFVQAVTRYGGDFMRGLSAYASQYPVQAVTASQWLDFGHVGTFHRSRRAVTTERAFNTLIASKRSVTKTGRNARKIEAEARWFESLPHPMRVYTPAYLGMQRHGADVSYSLEYMCCLTLADLFVFSDLKRNAWERIFEACNEFHSMAANYRAPPEEIDSLRESSTYLYLQKTMERLEVFSRQSGVDLTAPCYYEEKALPSLWRMAELAASCIDKPSEHNLSFLHGDFCFSNILYDFRSDQVRVIDPRGLGADDQFSSFGDRRYDIGKLHHSAVGQYDHIISGYYSLERQDSLKFRLNLPNHASAQGVASAFMATSFAGQRPMESNAPAISVLLFLSMLPLHADQSPRQLAFLANAMRLFVQLDQGTNT